MTLCRCSGRVVKVLEAEVGIGQGLPIHCLENISFTGDVKRNLRERGTIFLNAELRLLTVSLTVVLVGRWCVGERGERRRRASSMSSRRRRSLRVTDSPRPLRSPAGDTFRKDAVCEN